MSSPQAPHIDGFRRVWMFPRNIRRIAPWKMAQIVALLRKHQEYGEWKGNQGLQNSFCKSLENAGLKRKGEQYDPRSGGPRTYFAQLKCLGLLFQRHDGTIFLTRAGEDLASGRAPLPIMQNLLLRHQYPSAYGNLANVRMNPKVNVKPFLFILELMRHQEIGSLTNEELAIPVIYGHNRDCLELCRDKVLKLRDGSSLQEVISDEEKDLYLPRSKGRDFNIKIANILDIANTCKNYLQACCLISVERRNGTQYISFSEDMSDVLFRHLPQNEVFLPVSEDEESFQRAYGTWDRKKDTRVISESPKETISAEDSIILSQFYLFCGHHLITDIPSNFIGKMKTDFGIPAKKTEEVILPHLAETLDFFESTFLNLSKGGALKAIAFEKAVTSLFRDRLHFCARHTGQLSRDSGVGGYSDVFVIALDNTHCGIIDTKASSYYNLSSSDWHAMVYNYIPNYRELCEDKPLELEFVSYIAGGFHGNLNEKLEEITSKSGIGCSAITARDFLTIAKSRPSPGAQPYLVDTEKADKIFIINNICQIYMVNYCKELR